MKLFGWYRDGEQTRLPIFSGIHGNEYQHQLDKSQQAFERIFLNLKRYAKYMLDISANAYSIWNREFKR